LFLQFIPFALWERQTAQYLSAVIKNNKMKKEFLYLCTSVVVAGCLLFGTSGGQNVADKTSKRVTDAASSIAIPAASPVHATPGTAFPGIIYIEM
jgi:hypothetical protein